MELLLDLSVLEKSVREQLGEYLPDVRVGCYPGAIFVEVIRNHEALWGVISNLPTDDEWFRKQVKDERLMEGWARVLLNHLWREIGQQAERL